MFIDFVYVVKACRPLSLDLRHSHGVACMAGGICWPLHASIHCPRLCEVCEVFPREETLEPRLGIAGAQQAVGKVGETVLG